MKTGSFTRWLHEHYGGKAFRKDGKISKQFVRSHYRKWSAVMQRKAVFFLNSVKG